MVATVERCGTGSEPLRRLVAKGWPELVAGLAAHDRSLPTFVGREVERFLRCGELQHGFAWLWCDDWDVHRLVPFSCKSRTFCPSCAGRRMADRAAHLVDYVFRRVRVRQWVLTLPFGRRYLLARRPDLLRGVLAIAVRVVLGFHRRRARTLGIADGRAGAATASQRFRSSLRLNIHFHTLVPDGVFHRDAAGRLSFRHLPAPTDDEVSKLVATIATRAERWLATKGFPQDEPVDEDRDDDEVLPLLVAASMEGRVAVGPNATRAMRRLRRADLLPRRPPRCAGTDTGYELHANTFAPARSKKALEKLCRYVCRPPVALSRLKERPDGDVELHLKRPWADGTTSFVMTPAELTEKLVAVMPRPRQRDLHLHGVFAPHAAWRVEAVPAPPKRRPGSSRRLTRKQRGASTWRSWAEMLRRTFGTDSWACPCCGRRMQLRAVVIGRYATTRVLAGLAGAPAPPTPA